MPRRLRVARLRAIRHDQRLTVVGHLHELRIRLLVSTAVLACAFAVCFWQNHRLLRVIDGPLAHETRQQVRDGRGPLGASYRIQQGAHDLALQMRSIVAVLRTAPQKPTARAALAGVEAGLRRDAAQLSAPPQGDRPVTLGIGEPFTTTATVSLIFALILSLPVLLWQLYAFLIPALDPVRRRRVRPVVLAVPVLFLLGVAFGYLVVLPAAVRFFQNFNAAQFNVLVQAGQYYKFAATTVLAMGLLFQVPVAILAVTRAGVISARQLRGNRRYAIAACAAIAALLPGDAITMVLETLPLYLLFELSVLVAALGERRGRRSVLQPERASA